MYNTACCATGLGSTTPGPAGRGPRPRSATTAVAIEPRRAVRRHRRSADQHRRSQTPKRAVRRQPGHHPGHADRDRGRRQPAQRLLIQSRQRHHLGRAEQGVRRQTDHNWNQFENVEGCLQRRDHPGRPRRRLRHDLPVQELPLHAQHDQVELHGRQHRRQACDLAGTLEPVTNAETGAPNTTWPESCKAQQLSPLVRPAANGGGEVVNTVNATTRHDRLRGTARRQGKRRDRRSAGRTA